MPIILVGVIPLIALVLLAAGVWAAFERDSFAEALFGFSAGLAGFLGSLILDYEEPIHLVAITAFCIVVIFLLGDAFVAYLKGKL